SPSRHVSIQAAAGGALRAASRSEAALTPAGALIVAASDPGGDDAYVDLPWLDAQLGTFGSAAEFEVVTLGGHSFVHVAMAPGASVGFVPATLGDAALYTLGDQSSVRLQSRPMKIGIVETPGTTNVTRQLATPNGTTNVTETKVIPDLALSFEGTRHDGQPVFISRAWLASMGIRAPRFAHQDGAPIPSQETAEGWLLQPAHFSIIYTFDTSNEGFQTYNDTPQSYIVWDSANHRVAYAAQRADCTDEHYRHATPVNLSMNGSFTATVKWQTTQQGNWQSGWPLYFSTGDADNLAATNFLGIYYYSRDSNLHQNPQYYMQYHDRNGTARLSAGFDAVVNVEYHFFIGYDAGSRNLSFEIRDARDNRLASSYYLIAANAPDGFNNLPYLGIATEGIQIWCGVNEPLTYAWVDTINVTPNPTVSANLTRAKVLPDTGKTGQRYTYTVGFSHERSEFPVYVRAEIDGVNSTMSELDPSDTNTVDCKCYVYNTTLGAGNHSYRFFALLQNGSLLQTPLIPGPNVTDEVYFSDDAESASAGWQATGQWHRSLANPFSGFYSWYYGNDSTGNYADPSQPSGTLTSPPIDLSGATGVIGLSYASWYDTEDQGTLKDTKKVEVSTNGGSTWTLVDQVSGPRDYQWWAPRVVNLTPYAGSTVLVRFSFAADAANNNHAGWFIDDIAISDDTDRDSLPDYMEDTSTWELVSTSGDAKAIPDLGSTNLTIPGLDRFGLYDGYVTVDVNHPRWSDLVVSLVGD